MTKESFLARVQKIYRVAIPKNIYELLKLKEGDLVRVRIEKIKK